MSLDCDEIGILEPGNGSASDIEVEVDELFGTVLCVNLLVNLNHPLPNEEAPSPMFTKIDFEIVESICEERSMLEEGSMSLEMNVDNIRLASKFKTKEELQLAVKKYCIAQHYQFVVTKSNQDMWYVKCKQWNDGCKWTLHARRRKSHRMFEISVLEEVHSCLYAELTHDHSQLDSNFMCNEIQNIVRRDPSTSVVSLQEVIKKDFGYCVNYRRMWQAKRKALIKVFGAWEKSYEELPYWLNALVHYNADARVLWDLIPSNKPGNLIFGRVFWSFGPTTEGLKHCRPLIQIDGTHLYGKYKGKLLIVTSIDANGLIFLIAFAIVEEENTSS
ncbi:uncharacterized protein LOC111021598 [Momordica charantia]|uniref:Uncharacterized protein LOC111021598 n=1 Tax=Momordica charantia TaxID=3673 RepID=A0A6J1DJZ1_MOMCH|nr:uncharacterized protein LOC111021598 [Momordica charantia]